MTDFFCDNPTNCAGFESGIGGGHYQCFPCKKIERLTAACEAHYKDANRLAIDNRRLTAEGTLLRKALNDLVALKDYRAWHGKTPAYLKKKPAAWQQARDALKSTLSDRQECQHRRQKLTPAGWDCQDCPHKNTDMLDSADSSPSLIAVWHNCENCDHGQTVLIPTEDGTYKCESCHLWSTADSILCPDCDQPRGHSENCINEIHSMKTVEKEQVQS